MMQLGVTLRDPDSFYFSHDTQIAADVQVGANVVFGPGVSIETGAIIHPFCHIEGAHIGPAAQIGPFARLRPGTNMGAESKAGNFVEIKKSFVGKGSKINHLSYIGDAEIAGSVNIGAGTITCNYDGFKNTKPKSARRIYWDTLVFDCPHYYWRRRVSCDGRRDY